MGMSLKFFQNLLLSNSVLSRFRFRSSLPGVFLRKGVLKIWSKFTANLQRNLQRGVCVPRPSALLSYPRPQEYCKTKYNTIA